MAEQEKDLESQVEETTKDEKEEVAQETVETEEAVDGEETEAEETQETEGEKKSIFGKKKDKKDKKDEQIEELTDKLKRQMAEFDNYRKRTEKENTQMYEIGAKSIIEKILPVIDNFERGFAGVTEEQKADPFVSGMDMVYKQMMTALEEAGVKPIEAVGTEFNPDFHNAVMHEENEEAGENQVVEEFQKGYMYKETVVRHSMVKVAN